MKISSIRIIYSLLLTLLIQCERCTGLKILGVFPFTSRSHFMMTGRLMKELALRGHKVTVVNQFPQKKPISNYTDIVVRTPKQSFGINNVEYGDLKMFQSYLMVFFSKTVGTDLCDLLSDPGVQKVMKTPKKYYDVIVLETLMSPCYLALSQHLDAPIVGIVALKLPEWLMEPFGTPVNPSYVSSVFGLSSQNMTFWERLQNTLITNSLKYQMNYLLEGQAKYVEKHFGRKLSSIQELYEDVSLMLVNTHHSLHDIHPITPDIIEVGGLHVFDDEQQLTPKLQRWLDESTDGCILFTLGSMIRIETYPLKIIKVFYETFKRIAPMRVIMKIANASELPPGLPKNVKTFSWLPQVAVLRHKNIKLFITHGGIFSMQEAVAHSVPMIGLPVYADETINLKSCADKKLAIMLNLDETLTADSLTNAISTVLTDPVYRQSIARVSKIFLDRPMSPLDTAVYWVEYTARYGKVLKSPATRLTWWQLHLLDVYGFIFLCLIIIFYVAKRIMKYIVRFIIFRRKEEIFQNGSESKKIK